mgnify:CR=1 FL=1
MKSTLLLLASSPLLLAGPFSPAANVAGSNAIAKDDARITRWASGVESYLPGEDVDETWQDSSNALGPATGEAFDIVCLGRGGSITLSLSEPLFDHPGPDFAVFENSFSHQFLELAFVEVSSDGIHFTRFPNRSLTPNSVGSFGLSDPTNIDGLAGKFIGGFGTPFDLAQVSDAPNLDVQQIRYIRLVDIAGDGSATDSSGDPIYDPYPTFGSAGFDLDAIAILDAPPLSVLGTELEADEFEVTWALDPNKSYRIYSNESLSAPWNPGETIAPGSRILTRRFDLSSGRQFWQLREEAMDR